MFCVSTFYHFTPLEATQAAKAGLREFMESHGVRGTILLAPEGLNGTISGLENAVRAVVGEIKKTFCIRGMETKESWHEAQPFGRAKVKLKKEIIRFDYPLQAGGRVGQHVDAEGWNTLIADPGVTVLDSRNSYEVHVGTFERALNPNIRTFTEIKDYITRELDPAKHPKIATFCTGGVRCEKLSAWMLEQGFEEVYQLNGGILKYIEDMPKAHSRWQGECFVFDERVAVNHDLEKATDISMCPECGFGLTYTDRAAGLCPHCGYV